MRFLSKIRRRRTRNKLKKRKRFLKNCLETGLIDVYSYIFIIFILNILLINATRKCNIDFEKILIFKKLQPGSKILTL